MSILSIIFACSTFTLQFTSFITAFNTTKHWANFQHFVQRFERSYGSLEEFHKRFEIFSLNSDFIVEHNSEETTYTLGVTPFIDMTEQEFSDFQGLQLDGPFSNKCSKFTSQTSSLPESYDWREHNAVTPVKDQGQCGSCYAFSTTNVLETFMRINNFTVDRLSEQLIVDCSPNDYGCEGGFMHTSFDFIIDNNNFF